jgi:hypothetical protein
MMYVQQWIAQYWEYKYDNMSHFLKLYSSSFEIYKF